MTKLDEIQERIDSFPTIISSVNAVDIILNLLTDIVSELKRIDADVKRHEDLLLPVK